MPDDFQQPNRAHYHRSLNRDKLEEILVKVIFGLYNEGKKLQIFFPDTDISIATIIMKSVQEAATNQMWRRVIAATVLDIVSSCVEMPPPSERHGSGASRKPAKRERTIMSAGARLRTSRVGRHEFSTWDVLVACPPSYSELPMVKRHGRPHCGVSDTDVPRSAVLG